MQKQNKSLFGPRNVASPEQLEVAPVDRRRLNIGHRDNNMLQPKNLNNQYPNRQQNSPNIDYRMQLNVNSPGLVHRMARIINESPQTHRPASSHASTVTRSREPIATQYFGRSGDISLANHKPQRLYNNMRTPKLTRITPINFRAADRLATLYRSGALLPMPDIMAKASSPRNDEPLPPTSPDFDSVTAQSSLDALHEISRKRIIDDEVDGEQTKRICSDAVEDEDDSENADADDLLAAQIVPDMHRKRTRSEESSSNSASSLEGPHRKHKAKMGDIICSMSSSWTLISPQAQERLASQYDFFANLLKEDRKNAALARKSHTVLNSCTTMGQDTTKQKIETASAPHDIEPIQQTKEKVTTSNHCQPNMQLLTKKPAKLTFLNIDADKSVCRRPPEVEEPMFLTPRTHSKLLFHTDPAKRELYEKQKLDAMFEALQSEDEDDEIYNYHPNKREQDTVDTKESSLELPNIPGILSTLATPMPGTSSSDKCSTFSSMAASSTPNSVSNIITSKSGLGSSTATPSDTPASDKNLTQSVLSSNKFTPLTTPNSSSFEPVSYSSSKPQLTTEKPSFKFDNSSETKASVTGDLNSNFSSIAVLQQPSPPDKDPLTFVSLPQNISTAPTINTVTAAPSPLTGLQFGSALNSSSSAQATNNKLKVDVPNLTPLPNFSFGSLVPTPASSTSQKPSDHLVKEAAVVPSTLSAFKFGGDAQKVPTFSFVGSANKITTTQSILPSTSVQVIGGSGTSSEFLASSSLPTFGVTGEGDFSNVNKQLGMSNPNLFNTALADYVKPSINSPPAFVNHRSQENNAHSSAVSCAPSMFASDFSKSASLVPQNSMGNSGSIGMIPSSPTTQTTAFASAIPFSPSTNLGKPLGAKIPNDGVPAFTFGGITTNNTRPLQPPLKSSDAAIFSFGANVTNKTPNNTSSTAVPFSFGTNSTIIQDTGTTQPTSSGNASPFSFSSNATINNASVSKQQTSGIASPFSFTQRNSPAQPTAATSFGGGENVPQFSFGSPAAVSGVGAGAITITPVESKDPRTGRAVRQAVRRLK